jgi:hypothetical protein
MMAITVWQPWASLIAAGCKPIEWRGRPYPDYLLGQRIAIHAGARRVYLNEITGLLLDLRRDDQDYTSLVVEPSIALLERWRKFPEELPRSTVLCTAILARPIRAPDYAGQRGIDSDRIDHTKWGWPLMEIEPVIPMAPATGRQGFWRWIP